MEFRTTEIVIAVDDLTTMKIQIIETVLCLSLQFRLVFVHLTKKLARFVMPKFLEFCQEHSLLYQQFGKPREIESETTKISSTHEIFHQFATFKDLQLHIIL